MKNTIKVLGNLNQVRSAKVPLLIFTFMVIGFLMTACPTNDGGTGNTGDTASFSNYVSTSESDEYAYELVFESATSARTSILAASARASVTTPADGENYSLIVYGVNDKKVKGISEGKIHNKSGGFTLKPDATDEEDITVTGGEMTEITGKTKKGGVHNLPGRVKPFKQTEGVSGDFRYATSP